MLIHLEIVTPDRLAYADDVNFVTAPGISGTLGILPRHAPLFAQLTEGEIKIRKDKDEIFLAIGGGFIEVTKNKVMILVTRAVHAHELNETEIINAQKQAQDAIKNPPSVEARAAAQILLRQSIIDLKLLRRRKLRN